MTAPVWSRKAPSWVLRFALGQPATADFAVLAFPMAAIALVIIGTSAARSFGTNPGWYLAWRSHVALGAALAVVGAVWVALRWLRWAGVGSGSGLLLAAYGLWSRAFAEFSLGSLGPVDVAEWDSRQAPQIAVAVLLRHTGVVAFGLGL